MNLISVGPTGSRRLRWLALPCLTVALMLGGSGCVGTVRMYSGPGLAKDQIAIVRNPNHLEVIAVNDAAPPRIRPFPRKRMRVEKMEFLPGNQEITVVRDIPKERYSGAASVNRLAVRKSTLKFEAFPGSVFVIGEDLQESPTFEWTPWIKEVTMGIRPVNLTP